ncbi:MAG TPA: ATP-binding cassette domain-containing protein, partial [Niabella sp.]|nr:ATP-binding cassette domain-containing protein [Niabella sp.]
MSKHLINIKNLSVYYSSKTVLKNISFQFFKGDACVVRGQSGSGKTTLGKALAGLQKYQGQIDFNFDLNSVLLPKVLFVENWYRFSNLEGDRNFYYQQRYNHQQKRDTVSIARELELFGKEHSLKNELPEELLAAFEYHKVLTEQLFEISSGEHKKLQLIKALWWQPQWLIIDQPYTGLDANSRNKLNQLLDDYVARGGQLILLSNDDELPSCINRFATIENGKLTESSDVYEVEEKVFKPLPYFLTIAPEYTSNSIVDMKNVSVRYDDKYVLSDINWKVNAGERWLLQGSNGSGKSTLLSLITADHPQAYANDIKLFGVQRGGGES